MIDLQLVLEQRIKDVLESEKGLVANPDLMDDWGTITFLDSSGEPVRIEFIETERSWRRSDAVQTYNDLADDGVEVVVIVPEAVLETVDRHLGTYANPDIQLATLDDIGIEVKEVIPSQ